MEYEPYDDETEVAIGTAVEIPEDDTRKKPVHVQDQVVTDEQGACIACVRAFTTFMLSMGSMSAPLSPMRDAPASACQSHSSNTCTLTPARVHVNLQADCAVSRRQHSCASHSPSQCRVHGGFDRWQGTLQPNATARTCPHSLAHSKSVSLPLRLCVSAYGLSLSLSGRRRFHGAFTGGFSAGYFNSVGSEQGWAPKTFKSSRADRAGRGAGAGAAGRPVQSVEDFMDEEDRSEIGFAPQRVAATQAFEAPAASTPAPVAEGGALAGAEFRDLVVPADNTIGVKLLRALGWRPGQGVGPRVSATAKRRRRRADPDGGGTTTGG